MFSDVDFGPRKDIDTYGTKSLFYHWVPQSYPKEGVYNIQNKYKL